MPTGLATFDSLRESAPACQEWGAPLRVLARVPWISGQGATPSIATPAPLTHFEYLTGEFGLSCEAPTTLPQSDPPASRLPMKPVETIAPLDFNPLPITAAEPKLTDFMLRLESMIEPYTRAIVLLLLLAVVAFTVLLLRPAESEPLGTSAPLTTERSSVAAMPAAESPANSQAAAVSKPKACRPKIKETTEVEPPIAKGPTIEPPVATLSADIRPVPPDSMAEDAEYPSVELPPLLVTGRPSEEDASAPREARQRSEVMPAPPLQ